jgi:hypothetical protein
MSRTRLILLPALVAASLTMLSQPAAAVNDGDEGLGNLISQRLRAGGSFFTAEEQAVIRRACGYGEGEWDGFEINFDDDELVCENGRRVDSPEVRRVMRQAGPRIASRVGEVMGSDEVRGRINRITEQATARAMEEVARHRQDYARIAEEATARAMQEVARHRQDYSRIAQEATARAMREVARHQHDYARVAREATERAMRELDRHDHEDDRDSDSD